MEAQPCDPNTPTFNVDLSSAQDTVWFSPDTVREGLCCSASSPDRCIEFIVTLHPKSLGIKFEIASGAIPPGALFYELECLNPTQVGDTMCLTGPGPHRITFCKPGNNKNMYSITPVNFPEVSPPITVSDGCSDTLFASGFVESSITWTSVPYNATYNSYLSCTTACDTTIVTATFGYPPYVDYQVGGLVETQCGNDTIYDTVRVHFVSDKFVEILPKNPAVCFGGTLANITATPSGGAPPYTYIWSTGETTQTIAVGPGTYWVQVNDTTNCPPVFDTVVVTSHTLPITANTGGDQILCSDTPIVDLFGQVQVATGGTWSGGSGTFLPDPDSLDVTYTPTPAEISAGSVMLYLTTTGNQGCPAVTDSALITFMPTTTADFTFSNACLQGNNIVFNNASTYDISYPVSWNWQFGDATSSTSMNPSHTYLTADTFTVQLAVNSNNLCYDTAIKEVIIYGHPNIDFTHNGVCYEDSVQFTDLTTLVGDTLQSWQWLFGDGGSSTIQNPSHAYTAYGAYEVSLIVESIHNCADTLVDSIYISPKIQTSISASDQCLVGNIVHFGNSSFYDTTMAVNWFWTFGDGGTSTQFEPSHGYASNGTYTVTLIGSMSAFPGCEDTTTISLDILENPVAAYSSTAACFEDSVWFTDGSSIITDSIISWHWNFGDGDSSHLQDPSHYYVDFGDYEIELIVVSSGGCADTITDSIAVYPQIEIDFSFLDACLQDSPHVFTNLTYYDTNRIVNWLWDFGDGFSGTAFQPNHTYTNYGIYTVSLTGSMAINSACSNTITKTIEIYEDPIADFFTDAACFKDSAIFQDLTNMATDSITSWLWIFGDGDSSALQNPLHQYASDGTYTITLYVSSSHGCSDSISKTMNVLPGPQADFAFNNACVYDQPINFTNLSTYYAPLGILYFWDFDDGNVSAAENPSHSFLSGGDYSVSLVALIPSSPTCTDTSIQTVSIHHVPQANYNTTAECFKDSVYFTDLTTLLVDSVISWSWYFGDGDTADTQNPAHFYSSSGTYSLTLIVESDSGCIDTLSDSINVVPSPRSLFYMSDICSDSNLFLSDSSYIPYGSIVSWTWDMGDGTIYNTQNISHQYELGSYTIQLITESDFGCFDTLSESFSVHPSPLALFNFDGECFNLPTVFEDSSYIDSSASIIQWNWSLGDGNFSSDQDFEHIYGAVGGYVVNLTVTSDSGCTDDTAMAVTIHDDYPIANFTTDTLIVAPEQEISFNNLSQNATIYDWDFGDGGSSILSDPMYTYSDTGFFTITLFIKNDRDCIDSIQKDIAVRLAPRLPNAFSPNGDGKNDVLYVRGGPFNNLSFFIYNRWGEVLFTTTNEQVGWSGVFQGKMQPVGVYVYTLEATTLDNEIIEESGDITLIR